MTYSIVARDQTTGELGVAVQSHWFSVGPIVAWAESGVGAVATQSMVDPAYGPRGLDGMRSGRSPEEVLRDLTAADEGEAVRQVALVDAQGRVAVHTGSRCIADAGHVTGDGFSVQANMMRSPEVWPAMANAFESTTGPLADRLLAALDAAEAAGGDIRGRQSAAMVVVRAEPTGQPWVDRVVDVRVDDHADPLGELRRLVRLRQAYDRMNRGDELASTGDMEGALGEYTAAADALGDNPEPRFWQGIMLATTGDPARARPLIEQAARIDPGWAELVRRLPPSGLLPEDLVDRLLGDS